MSEISGLDYVLPSKTAARIELSCEFASAGIKDFQHFKKVEKECSAQLKELTGSLHYHQLVKNKSALTLPEITIAEHVQKNKGH